MEKITSSNVDSAVEFLLANPSVSYWLKDRIREIGKRDIVDALRDVQILSTIASAKCDKALSR